MRPLKALEFETKVSVNASLNVPGTEAAGWRRLASEQFLRG
jgi:hypothetical protein